MKILPRALILFLVVLVALESCKTKTEPEREKPIPKPKPDYTFSGRVTSIKGETIADARIYLNGKEVKSGKEGEFKITGDSSNRFIITIKKRGFGTVSKIFREPMRDYNYRMRPAFTKVIDPTKPNEVKDALSTDCVGCGFQNLGFDAEYKKIPFIYDANGNLTDFGWTSGLKPVFDQLSGPPLCNPGATVMLPANSVVNGSGQTVTTPVTISIATVDLQSPDGMPGDFTYENENQQGSMQSMGAVTIELYDEKGEENYNIDPKAKKKVTLSVPADPLKYKIYKGNIPETIPVLYYDERKGVWRQENKQMAKLNKKTKSYETEVNHFSSINLDFFSDPTCIRFRQVPTSATAGDPGSMQPSFRIYAWTTGANFTTHAGTESPTGCFVRPDGTNLHVLYNAPPPGQEVAIVMTNNSSSPNAFYGIAIIKAGNSAPPNALTACPGTECDETVATCEPFHPECVYLPLTLFAQNAILAMQKEGSDLRLKWVFRTAPPSSSLPSYEYFIEYKDASAPSFTRIPSTAGTYLTGNYDVTTPINTTTIPAASLSGIGTVEVRIIIHDGTGGSDQISNSRTLVL